MRKKLKRILLCLILGIASLFGAAACSTEEVRIVLVEELYREDCVLNEEFDVTCVLDNYNEDWDYKITECFYIDNFDDLKRYDIPLTGDTTFIQTAPYDVHVVLVAEKGKQSAELEFVLTLVIRENDMQTEMITSWSETGVSKRIEGNKKYVLDGEESSVKVTYLGTTQHDESNGINIGSFVCDSADASFTSWDNAVMTFSVYNPQNYDIQLGWMVTKNKDLYNKIGYMQDAVTLTAGEWTKVDWSLRAVGLNWDITSGSSSEALTVYFKMRIQDASDMVAPYNYTLYFGGLDLADYSPALFPYLETRTADEIWYAQEGDDSDKSFGGNYTAKGTDISRWFTTKLSAKINEYADGQTKAVEDSASYVEYTMTATGLNKNHYTGNFLDFSDDKPIGVDLYRTCRDIDWKNAYITFWAYNNTPNAVCQIMGMGEDTFGEEIVSLPYGEWTQVSVSLKYYYGITTDVFAKNGYELKMYVVYAKTGCHTEETYADFASSLYIDGFAIESRYAGENAWLTGNYTAKGSDVSKYFPTKLAAEEKPFADGQAKPCDEATSYVEYAMTATGAASWQYVGNFLDFSASHPIDSEAYERYQDIDWSSAYMTFWAYNDNATTGETCKIYALDILDSVYTNPIAVLPYGEWTKVEVSLGKWFSVTSDPFVTDDHNIKLFVQYAHGGYNADTYADFGASLYITGVTFYNPDESKVLADNYTMATTGIYRFYDTTLTTAVGEFGTVSAPESTEYTSYIEYTLTTNANKGDDTYYANFLNFSAYTDERNTRSTAAIPEYLYEKYKNVDWSDAYISFWLYNDTDLTATLYGTKDTTGLDLSATNQECEGEAVTTVAARSWTKVTVSLKEYCNIQSDVIATGDYNIKLWLSVTDTSVEADNLAEKSWSFYMTGLEFISAEDIA